VGVIGVGLNLRPQVFGGLTSGYASLDELAGAPVDGSGVLALVAPALLTALRRFEREGLAPFAATYAARDLLRGRAVSATLPGLPEGQAEGVDASGALWVVDAAGRRHAVHAGEVSIRPVPAPGRDVAEQSGP
jgi:BirA family biotin operon repressor/biotin-[acetyl-CoA-carboxylase] ligase